MDKIVRANVYYDGQKAGELWKIGSNEYRYQYDTDYLTQPNSKPISYGLPLQEEPYISKHLFPFFEELISEGWLRDKQSLFQKIDERDSFTLLINNGEDLIGAVSVVPIRAENNNI